MIAHDIHFFAFLQKKHRSFKMGQRMHLPNCLGIAFLYVSPAGPDFFAPGWTLTVTQFDAKEI